MNTHQVADFAHELQATCYDLLPACIVSASWPTVPVPPSLTLGAFATQGYVKEASGTLVYVAQEAHTVTLTGGDGTYWLALGQDTWTTVASWNRTPGTHYLWRASATRPPDVDGVLVMIQLTVSGGAVTAAAPASGVTRAEALRAFAGLGTMATQNANAVAITGGTAVGLAELAVGGSGGTETASITGTLGVSQAATFYTRLGVGLTPAGDVQIHLQHPKSTDFGVLIRNQFADTGKQTMLFLNVAGTVVGSIDATATGTAFTTTSDVRLKTAIAPLSGATGVVRRLTPVTYLWRADGSRGYGFVAHEVAETIPDGGIVTGEPHAINEDGSIQPQQMDPGKLVPWLTASLQEAWDALDALSARLAALEARA